jgi:hypothetical protein
MDIRVSKPISVGAMVFNATFNNISLALEQVNNLIT